VVAQTVEQAGLQLLHLLGLGQAVPLWKVPHFVRLKRSEFHGWQFADLSSAIGGQAYLVKVRRPRILRYRRERASKPYHAGGGERLGLPRRRGRAAKPIIRMGRVAKPTVRREIKARPMV
jgi:hypothetical protein